MAEAGPRRFVGGHLAGEAWAGFPARSSSAHRGLE
jgi:hypothetical protein